MLAPRTASDRGRPPGAAQAATSHAGSEPSRNAITASSAGARSVSLENRMATSHSFQATIMTKSTASATSMPFSWAARLGQSGG